MLLPKRTKFRKAHKGRNRGLATTGNKVSFGEYGLQSTCLLYTSPSPRDRQKSRMPSSA